MIISVEVALGDGGLRIRDLYFQPEGEQFVVSFASGRILDGFDDATPTIAKVAIPFDGTQPPGTYVIQRLAIFDTSGLGNVYGTAQLKALGWPNEYTIVNSVVPAAPSFDIEAAADGLIAGGQALISGHAAPGSTVDVWAYRHQRVDNSDMSGTIRIGSALADADGKWSLTTLALEDGRYTDVKATATLGGHTSAYSAAQEFKVSVVTPITPQLHAVLGEDGHTDSATPFVSGFTTGGAIVKLFAGEKLVATTVADSGGWFGTRTTTLDPGSHVLTAVASNLSGASSPASAAVSLLVDAQPDAGIRFEIGRFANAGTIPVDLAQLKNILADVGGILSAMIEGNQSIVLDVDVRPDPAGASYAYAAAGASYPVLDPAGDMPRISNASLTLSTKFASDLIDLPTEKMRGYINVLVHEMLHVLGFNSSRDPFTFENGSRDFLFGELSTVIDGKLYFAGAHASAANGGPVELANPHHLAERDDNMHPSAPVTFSEASFFGPDNPTAPLTAVDLGILKDLGYTVKQTVLGSDGHTFIAGSGKEGYRQVDGTPGVDTLFINQARDAFDGAWTAGEYVLTQRAANVAYELAGIERIRFADTTLAIDVDGSAGQVYRLYQAVLGRTPDAAGLGFWIEQVDKGMSLAQAADGFAASAEFQLLYGVAPSSEEIVTRLYANVLKRAPDQGGYDYWLPILQRNPDLVEEVLVAFSESTENKEQVAAVIGDGFIYQPYG